MKTDSNRIITMELGAGIATFASCDKAGSIPHFTVYLQSHPYDYTALMWRGRAYGIIGETEKAAEDFRRAARCCYGLQKGLAEYHCARIEGQREKAGSILNTTVQNYPRSGEVWSEVGTISFYSNKYDDSLPKLKKAISLGKEHRETTEPWYPWANHHVGEIYYSKRDVYNADDYYNAAIDSCDTLTVAHIGKGKCNVIKRYDSVAKASFQRAKKLNPKLVDNWDDFEAFKKEISETYEEAEAKARLHSHLGRLNLSARDYGGGDSNRGFGSGQNDGGGQRGASGGGGRGGGRGGNGGDDGNDGDGYIWKKIQTAASKVMKHDDERRFTKLGNFWFSRDKAGHATSFCKVYIERGKTIYLVGSVPINIFKKDVIESAVQLNDILSYGPNLEHFDMIPKHESRNNTHIKLRDLHVVR